MEQSPTELQALRRLRNTRLQAAVPEPTTPTQDEWAMSSLLEAMLPEMPIPTRNAEAKRLAQLGMMDEMVRELLQKAQNINTKEKRFLNDMFERGMASEQMLVYLEAPRQKYDGITTEATRESLAEGMAQTWADQTKNFTTSLKERFVNGGGTLLALSTIAGASVVAATGVAFQATTTGDLGPAIIETAAQMVNMASDTLNLPGNMATAAGGAAIVGGGLTAWSLKNQRKASRELAKNLNVAKNLEPATGGLMAMYGDKEAIEQALEAIPRPQHHLIKHLKNTDLRLFLLSEGSTREAILTANPPSHEARVQCVLAEPGTHLSLAKNLLDATLTPWAMKNENLSETGLLSSLRKMRDEARQDTAPLQPSLPTRTL